MLELGGQQPSTAMVAMNQLTTGGQHLKATVNRRRKKPSGVPNPKRMFEEVTLYLVKHKFDQNAGLYILVISFIFIKFFISNIYI